MAVDLTTYGVTPADVAARFGELSLAEDTRPSTADVELWVRKAAAKLTEELRAMQVALPETEDFYFLVCQNIVVLSAAIPLGTARGRGAETLVPVLQRERDHEYKTLRSSPQRLGRTPGPLPAPNRAYRTRVKEGAGSLSSVLARSRSGGL